LLTDIEQIQRIKELEQKEKYLQILNTFAISLMHQHTVHDIVWDIARTVISQMEFVDCVIYIVDQANGVLIQQAAFGHKNPKDREISEVLTIPIGQGIVGHVALTGKAEIINDTSIDSRYILDDQMRFSEIAVPMLVEGEVIGIIDSEHPDKYFFNNLHLDLLTTVANMAGVKIKRARLEEELLDHRVNLEKLVQDRTLELQKTLKFLEASNNDLVHFAYATSHDLKEPIRMIVSFLQLIEKREEKLQDKTKEDLQFIISSARRMHRILDELLVYSKVNAQNENGDLVSIDNILQEVKNNLRLLIETSGTTIEVPNNLPDILGFEILLIQLFQNLISNAIKFRNEELKPHIRINYDSDVQFHIFKITDNGIGIPREYHTHIFELFQRLDRTAADGSGVGLALCQRIVERHNGTIRVLSSSQSGTTFEFTIAKTI
jgi:signal transduction histidine kinase